MMIDRIFQLPQYKEFFPRNGEAIEDGTDLNVERAMYEKIQELVIAVNELRRELKE